MATTKAKPVAELIPDDANVNKGTARGRAMLVNSLKQYGAGRSLLIDKNGRLIAGNKTYEAAREAGAVAAVKVVESDGKDIIAVKRLDIDLLNDEKARALAYADNRVAEINLFWDVDELARQIDNGLDVSAFWFEDELAKLLGGETGELEPGGAGAQEDAQELNNPTGVRMVQLYLNDDNYPAFVGNVNRLMTALDKSNNTDTVLEVLRRQAAAVPSELETGSQRRIDVRE